MSTREIFVLGYACRTPAGATPEQLWDAVLHGRDTITRASTNIGATSGSRVHAYGVLPGFEDFDAGYFGYSPREAADIDPQQRLLLECAVEALESSCVLPAAPEYDLGVFVSSGLSSYLLNTWDRSADEIAALPALLGGDPHYAATRIAYKLGSTGPAVSLGSACSSSLLAVHYAAQSILSGECDIALAGGMDVEFPQPMSYLHQQGGIMSRDGTCRPFDEAASGTVFGSGGGLVVLADAETARKHGLPVRAALAGSAVNNDGAEKASFTAPRGSRQRDVIRQALAVAAIEPAQVRYLECHGTATELGDRTELTALEEVFGESSLPALGSVKANIGHLRVGAGVVSFIKACEIATRGVIPPATNVTAPVVAAAAIDEPRPLRPESTEPPFIGVSSFGFGGTNVHAVLTSVSPGEQRTTVDDDGTVSIRLSSAGPESCLAGARALADHLVSSGVPVAAVARTLATARQDREYRYAAVGTDRADVAENLRRPGETSVEGWLAPVGRIVTVLPGQGAEPLRLARALHGWEPAFTGEFDRLWEEARRREPDLPGIAELFAGPPPGGPAGQVLHLVVQLALCTQLAARGVRQDLIAGYSIGEYAAAAAAGLIGREAAIDLVLVRARLLKGAPPGDMVVVNAGQETVSALFPDRIPAITMSPRRHVYAVLEEDLAEFTTTLAAEAIGAKVLRLGVPYHSPVLSGLAEKLVSLTVGHAAQPNDAFIPTAEGDPATGNDYWGTHLSGPVDFSRVGTTVAELQQTTPCTILDLSGDGHLARVLGESGADTSDAVKLFATGEKLRENYLLGLARLWIRGFEVETLAPGHEDGGLVSLPSRSFDRQRHLAQPRATAAAAGSGTTRRTIQREDSLDDWIYHPSWRLRRRPKPRPRPAGEERWLVFAGESPEQQEIALGLARTGTPCTVIAPGGEGDGVIAGDEEAIRRLIADLEVEDQPITRIVHLWCLTSLADGGTLEARLESKENELRLGFYTLLYAVQELAARQGAGPLELDIVATGIHPAGADGEGVIPERALLLGPALVMPQDLPFVSARTIDTTGLTAGQLVPEVLAELTCLSTDRNVALTPGQRWARCFEPCSLAPVDEEKMPLRLRERGVYLITGGLGGIGMTLAEYLVRTCRARLVLTALEAVPDEESWLGDGPLPQDPLLAERVIRLRKLIELGGEILAARCDAASAGQTTELFRRIDERFGRLDGVVHAAGVFETQRAFRGLEETTAEDCERRLLPKVDGTIVLAEHLRGRELDFVLMQSSLSAQLGGLGFYAYTAGNAYMDAFAERNRSADVPWMSVNWDGWIFRERTDDAGGQSVVSPSFASPDFGVVAEIAIRPSEGAEIYSRMMNLAQPEQVLVSTADFEARYEQWVRRPLGPRPSKGAGKPASLDDVEETVVSLWQEVLGVTEVAPDSNFFALGGDSLLGVTLAYRLGQAFGTVLSVITMFDNPTVQAMSSEIRIASPALREEGSLR
ncbi:SDR family NAD(P)-dependent oxidoreductase [Amycolatopsis sp. PS_44_ISF1]|uniref:SDR family NAD(P)-dependent oxidoreductase n=1 Tax=Amycolatopsis sp. PS_44_ISF1 TaxID=2974917 RepID=UPI0028DFEB23|nr:SDR family NAD(P)-dependent oxidoreductase [Amycolatopsis sp. PS_44_ISF1]MDT8911798.1 SDR family NAD(P)-dependent oxidoreductase [Amycolatopsis sp. PS_44_ISF1]